MTSIDGSDPPKSFMDEWIPFMIQSPLVSYIPILSTALFQATARHVDIEKSVDTIAVRMKLINLINEHITTHSKGVNEEAIAAVMSLSYNEVLLSHLALKHLNSKSADQFEQLVYADKKSVLAHMSGLRSMIRTKGGIQNVQIGMLRKLIAR